LQNERTPNIRGVINNIAGGFAGGGSSASARKKHLQAVQAVNSTIRPIRHRIPPITFTNADFRGIDPFQDDPMVIMVELEGFVVKKTLVDQGSSVDVLYWETFKKLQIPKGEVQLYEDQIVGFSKERVDTKGYIDLYTKFGGGRTQAKIIKIRYLLIEANTSYNILLGRPSLNLLGAIVSTPHLAMKFPSLTGDIITVHVDKKEARECYVTSLRIEPLIKPTDQISERAAKRSHLVALIELYPRFEEVRVEPKEETCYVPLLGESKTTNMGVSLSKDDADQLSHTLQKNADAFAWTVADMPGVDPSIMVHRLSTFKDVRPIAQKKRKLGEEKRIAAKEEAEKLLQVGFIREAHYTTWLANVVLVRKPNGKWRMCTDYTDLNKACPKDSYPLPSIDRLVDGAAGHKYMSFLDTLSGYNQISMHPHDIAKTAFMTDDANYVYKVMPFGLKNAGATYQRLMDKIFKGLIGRNVEIYVDDMVVKSTSCTQHIQDLTQVFRALKAVGMRLNPEKCVFGVEGGKFLGFMLTDRGIEANPNKCQAIMEMQSPKNIKDVQRLVGRVVALSRFMPKMVEKIKPILSLIKKASRFKWDEECENAFTQLKTFLASPPVIQKPCPNQPIVVYLSVSRETISAVLI